MNSSTKLSTHSWRLRSGDMKQVDILKFHCKTTTLPSWQVFHSISGFFFQTILFLLQLTIPYMMLSLQSSVLHLLPLWLANCFFLHCPLPEGLSHLPTISSGFTESASPCVCPWRLLPSKSSKQNSPFSPPNTLSSLCWKIASPSSKKVSQESENQCKVLFPIPIPLLPTSDTVISDTRVILTSSLSSSVPVTSLLILIKENAQTSSPASCLLSFLHFLSYLHVDPGYLP